MALGRAGCPLSRVAQPPLEKLTSLLTRLPNHAARTTGTPRSSHDAPIGRAGCGNEGATLTEDFLDAMDRHWQDAELLYRKQRLANADHLYGLSAECGLKELLKQDGNRIEGRTRCHINKLWRECGSLASGRAEATSDFNPEVNPFCDWRIDGRYAHRREIRDEQLERHRLGAERVRIMIKRRRGMP